VKSPLFKRSLLVGGALATLAASLISTSTGASATVTPQATSVVVAAGGSDTTEKVMDAIMAQANAPTGETWVNLPSFSLAATQVPGDANCPTMSWQPNGVTPVAPDRSLPSGSGAGRSMLQTLIADNNTYGTPATGVKGCLEIARSSAYSSSSGVSAGNSEYYGFALDAVSWATASLSAPAALSRSDLQKIYNCTITDWSQVPGGSAGPIQRYLPTTASGTYSFFLSDVLGSSNFNFGTSSASCPPVILVDTTGAPLEEHNASKINPDHWQSAILPYSAGQWVYQANNSANPTMDLRVLPSGGAPVRLGGILTNVDANGLTTTQLMNANPVAYNTIDRKWQLNDAGLQVVQPGAPGGYPVTEASSTRVNTVPAFIGVRLVYNVLDTRSPNYAQALMAVGFDNVNGSTTKSALCNGERAAIIASYGFAPLPTTGVTGTVAASANYNLAGSTCRKIAV
jgi:ABC-type phosphate transport system substrate-binding protein